MSSHKYVSALGVKQKDWRWRKNENVVFKVLFEHFRFDISLSWMWTDCIFPG